MYKEVMEVRSILETTYENGTSWVEYSVVKDDTDKSNYRIGYEVSASANRETNKVELAEMINGIPRLLKRFVDKEPVEVACSEFLKDLIIECLQSENEMWYVDDEDLEEEGITQEMLDALFIEVNKLDIQDCVTVCEGDYAICVYGDVITRFLF